MRKARTAALCLMVAGYGAGQPACAGSQFELGDETPVAGAVRLDFTIVIPEIMTLHIARDAQALRMAASPQAVQLPALTPSADTPAAGDGSGMPPRTPPHAHASTNAGTLAAGTSASHWSGQGVALDTHPAIFLVALP
jgi:hypothetical protein